MARGARRGPSPRQHASRQSKFGGGKFGSEKQRRFLWAVYPTVAKAWAHNRKTRKGQWKPRVTPRRPRRRGRRGRKQ